MSQASLDADNRLELVNDTAPLLANERYNCLSSSFSSLDEEHEELLQAVHRQNGKRIQIELLARKCESSQNRRHRHRSAHRVFKFLFCMLFMSMIYLVLYQAFNSNEQKRQVALPGWGYNISRHAADFIFPDNDTNLLEPRNVCHQKVFLLIIVCSGLHNFVERQTIRETWGNTSEFNYGIFAQLHSHLHGKYQEAPKERIAYYSQYLGGSGNITSIPAVVPVRVLFMVGRSEYELQMGNETVARLHAESEQYDDIIQENFIDTYKNLTLKSLFALKWLTRRCLQQSAFVMKCDDDTFVNTPNLLHYLLGGTLPVYNDTIKLYDTHSIKAPSPIYKLRKISGLMVGFMFCTVRPIANVSSKWYMPYYMYPEEKYPKYLSGAAYLMSMDVVPRLYESALNVSLIYLEDVYITGLCAEKAHLQRHHNALFSYWRLPEMCSFKGGITQHYLKNDSIAEAYAFVMNLTIHCKPPAKLSETIRLRKAGYCTQ